MKNRLLTCVALVCVLTTVALIPPVPAAAASSSWGLGWLKKMFVDEDKAPWAVGHMAKMKVRGFVTGYPDGRYEPNALVSRAELVTAAVRLIGAGEEAKAAEGSTLPFADSSFIESECSWAIGYLSVALDHDLIGNSSLRFYPNDPATRLWAAEVFARAMGLEAEAQEKMDVSLGYRDELSIPINKAGYVAVMRDKGVMIGSGNVFGPYYYLTRAELAVILDRCDERMPPRSDSEIRGVISSVDPDDAAISVRAYDNNWWTENGNNGDNADSEDVFTGVSSLSVMDGALILLDKEHADLEDLRQGYTVVVLKSKDAASVIDASTERIAGWPGSTEPGDDSGEVEEKPEEEPEEETEEAEDSTAKPDLIAGTVKSIEYKKYREISLRDTDGKTHLYEIATDCDVRFQSGKQSYVQDVRAGDEVTIEVASGKVVKITFGILAEALQEDEIINGTVSVVKSDRNSLIVNADDGTTVTVLVSTGATIRRDEKTARLYDLEEGDEVEIGVEDHEAIRIDAFSIASRQYSGEVTVLNLSASPRTIRIKMSNGTSETLEFHSTVTVKFKKLQLTVGEIVVGDKVSLGMSASKVREVDINERPATDIIAEVVSVATDDGYYRIRLKSASSTTSYAMTPGVSIKKGADTLKPRDLEAGTSVAVRLEGNVVTRVIVLD